MIYLLQDEKSCYLIFDATSGVYLVENMYAIPEVLTESRVVTSNVKRKFKITNESDNLLTTISLGETNPSSYTDQILAKFKTLPTLEEVQQNYPELFI